jgi:septal ring factor EnvC (AmiA/AmiB activator)
MYEYVAWMSGVMVVVCILWASKLIRDIREVNKSIEQSKKNIARCEKNIARLQRAIGDLDNE